MIKSLNHPLAMLKKLCPVADEFKRFQKCLNLYLSMINPVRKISILQSSLIRKKYLTVGCI